MKLKNPLLCALATLTVSILLPLGAVTASDPGEASGELYWGSADTITMEDSVAYFQLMAEKNPAVIKQDSANDKQLQELLDAIDAFEQIQAGRLYAAYRVIGPMLRDYPEYTNFSWEESR